MKTQISKRSFVLAINASLPDTAKKAKILAYAFSQGGMLLASAPLDAQGQAKLKMAVPEGATEVRVLVGPVTEKEASLDELLRRGAQGTRMRVEKKTDKAEVAFTILPPVIDCWLRSACMVSGTLLKRIPSGGVTVDYPVCNSRVEIYEVDPLRIILPRIPDLIIDRIRDIILYPIPEPGPDPGPEFTAGQAMPMVVRKAGKGAAAALKQVVEVEPLRYLAQNGNRTQFQQALIDHALLIRPLFCYFFPQLVTMQKVGEAWTDECGRFQALFFKGCHNPDVPDLYFKAYQRLFGFVELCIYEPKPVACHTWWDYACGTNVTLYTTSPLAVTCSPCRPVVAPRNWVLFTAIGNTSLKSIHGGGSAGTTDANWGLLESGAPWGGVLRPRLDFDNELRESLGVTHYQLSWRRGTAGGWTPFNAEVYRHYAHMVGSDLVIAPYKLGPNPVAKGSETLQLFEIPPAVPPVGQWTVANAVLDTENGEFDSTIHSRGLSFDASGAASGADESGLYQFKLELFDSGGNLIDIAAKGIVYVVPDTTDLSGVIHTVHADTVAQPTAPTSSTLVQGNALVLTLHVDNNHCWAQVGAPTTPAGAADACCGVVPYAPGATVSLPYTAYHPHGFASYRLWVYRSATNIVDIPGGVGAFTLTKSVNDMMTLNRPPACLIKPPCILAAFSEHLEVYAMSSDGWGSYLGYNAVADRAFALSPE
jgi:hypothetical protein